MAAVAAGAAQIFYRSGMQLCRSEVAVVEACRGNGLLPAHDVVRPLSDACAGGWPGVICSQPGSA